MDITVVGFVRADPEVVFRYLADLENWPSWQDDMKSTTLVDGERGQVGARYRYVSKAMGQTFDSTVTLVKVDPPGEVAFEGEWAGMMRPLGRYLVEEATAYAAALRPAAEHFASARRISHSPGWSRCWRVSLIR